jgi:hypothetical protein
MNIQPISLNETWIGPDGRMTATGQQLFNQMYFAIQWLWGSGTTASRPNNPVLGQLFYDTTLGEIIVCINIGSPTTGTPATWAPLSGSGGGTVTDVTGVAPINVIDNTTTPIVSLDNSGVAPGIYGDSTHVGAFAVDAQGIITAAANIALGSGGTVTSITASAPISITPDPTTTVGNITHLASGVSPGGFGDSTHVSQITVDNDGHVTAASNVAIAFPTGGFLKGQSFTSSGTFTVPANVTSLWITLIAGGGAGGGSTAAALAGGGGGSGETCFGVEYAVTPLSVYTVTIGAGGVAVTGANGGAGGNTLFDILRVFGGNGGLLNGTGGSGGGLGGGAGGGAFHPAGGPGIIGTPESSLYFGGGGGGGGGNVATANGGLAAGSGGYTGGPGGASSGTQAGGGGGSSTYYGTGATGAAGGVAGTAATVVGTGGSGAGGLAGSNIGGNGAPGYCLVQWIG